jgi:hypothetical protein
VISVLAKKGVDGRVKPGHDGEGNAKGAAPEAQINKSLLLLFFRKEALPL